MSVLVSTLDRARLTQLRNTSLGHLAKMQIHINSCLCTLNLLTDKSRLEIMIVCSLWLEQKQAASLRMLLRILVITSSPPPTPSFRRQ